MTTFFHAIRHCWFSYWAESYARTAAEYEQLAYANRDSSIGDVAMTLAAKSRYKALLLAEKA